MKYYFILIILVIFISGCSSKPDATTIIPTQNNISVNTNSVVIDLNNTKIDSNTTTTIVNDGFYTIITGKITNMVLCRDRSQASVFTFSDGTVILVNNAGSHTWVLNKLCKITAWSISEGYQVNSVEYL